MNREETIKRGIEYCKKYMHNCEKCPLNYKVCITDNGDFYNGEYAYNFITFCEEFEFMIKELYKDIYPEGGAKEDPVSEYDKATLNDKIEYELGIIKTKFPFIDNFSANIDSDELREFAEENHYKPTPETVKLVNEKEAVRTEIDQILNSTIQKE